MAQEISEVKSDSGTFDYSPPTETYPDEVAQAQLIASEDKDLSFDIAELAGPNQEELANAA